MRTIYTLINNYAGRKLKLFHGDYIPERNQSKKGDLWQDSARSALWEFDGIVWQPMGGNVFLYEDFLFAAGAILPKPWGTQDTSPVGTPVLDYVNNAAGGHFNLKLATDNEAEAITLYWADQLAVDIAKKPIVGFRLKIEPDVTGGSGNLGAGDIIVAGLASARNATLDSIAVNAWFRMEGANKNILCEIDDGTTDTDDKDTGQDWTANTFMYLMVDCTELNNVRFYVNGYDYTPQTMNMGAASGNVQPFIEIQKAAAVNRDHRVTIDEIFVLSAR